MKQVMIRIPLLILLHAFLVSVKSFSQGNRKFVDSIAFAIKQRNYPNVDAVLIAQNEKTVYENYFNDLTKDTLHDTRSAFKSVTALLLGIAIDKGFIRNVHEKVYSFFREYKQYRHQRIGARLKNITILDKNITVLTSVFMLERTRLLTITVFLLCAISSASIVACQKNK
jgi:hypothetical protein